MKFLELKVPPLALFAVILLSSYWLANSLTFASFPVPYHQLVSVLGVVVSGVIGVSAVWEFKKRKTTVNPIKVDTASLVVDSGIFGYSRNPMYLALFILLFCFGYYLQNLFSLSLSFLFVIYMNRFQVLPEEQALESLFGAEYVDYKQKVRRWV
ncbi:isoprenylcysteine carboxylmethyltransferase family protein [Vibrio sp. D173a]|uniref:methyltransferase family protein n=1 Tax=Vibrio sp. D173a TaxID=2836349 RepID=UPI0025577FCD|nr:isoprenylcysteine carboxylmethyltransferase family protein [Vibrio sp. D173a]MDK9759212.1 isoprenylcysteine carboxylmethyltransferase family protein [Vibrio sp. D173a]